MGGRVPHRDETSECRNIRQIPTKIRRKIIRELFPTTMENIGRPRRIYEEPEPFEMQEMLAANASMKIRRHQDLMV